MTPDLINAHLSHIRAAGFSDNTIDDREALLRRMDRSLPMGLRQATVEELEDWLAREGWSNQTKATYYGHVRGFFLWAGNPDRPMLDWDPSASLKRPRVPATLPRPVTADELAIARGRASEPWKLFVDLAAYAGLRCCELATIRREDVTKDWIVIKGKGGKTRVVGTSPVIWAAVEGRPPGPARRGRDGREHHPIR